MPASHLLDFNDLFKGKMLRSGDQCRSVWQRSKSRHYPRPVPPTLRQRILHGLLGKSQGSFSPTMLLLKGMLSCISLAILLNHVLAAKTLGPIEHPNAIYIFELPLGFTPTRPPKKNSAIRRIYDHKMAMRVGEFAGAPFIMFTHAQLLALKRFVFAVKVPNNYRGIAFPTVAHFSESDQRSGYLLPNAKIADQLAFPKLSIPKTQSSVVLLDDVGDLPDAEIDQLEPKDDGKFVTLYVHDYMTIRRIQYTDLEFLTQRYPPPSTPAIRSDRFNFDGLKDKPINKYSFFNPAGLKDNKNALKKHELLKYTNLKQNYCFFTFKKPPKSGLQMVTRLLKCMCKKDHIPHKILEDMMNEYFQEEHGKELKKPVPDMYELAMNHFHVEYVTDLAGRARQEDWMFSSLSVNSCVENEKEDYKEELQKFRKWFSARTFEEKIELSREYTSGDWQTRAHESVFKDALYYHSKAVDYHDHLEMHDKDNYAEVIRPLGPFRRGQLFHQLVYPLTHTDTSLPFKRAFKALRKVQDTGYYAGYLVRRTEQRLELVIFRCCLHPNYPPAELRMLLLDPSPRRYLAIEALGERPNNFIKILPRNGEKRVPTCTFLAQLELVEYLDRLPPESEGLATSIHSRFKGNPEEDMEAYEDLRSRKLMEDAYDENTTVFVMQGDKMIVLKKEYLEQMNQPGHSGSRREEEPVRHKQKRTQAKETVELEPGWEGNLNRYDWGRPQEYGEPTRRATIRGHTQVAEQTTLESDSEPEEDDQFGWEMQKPLKADTQEEPSGESTRMGTRSKTGKDYEYTEYSDDDD